MKRTVLSGVAVVAFLLLPAVPAAEAAKEVFKPTKPHVNVEDGNVPEILGDRRSRGEREPAETAGDSKRAGEINDEETGQWRSMRGGGLR